MVPLRFNECKLSAGGFVDYDQVRDTSARGWPGYDRNVAERGRLRAQWHDVHFRGAGRRDRAGTEHRQHHAGEFGDCDRAGLHAELGAGVLIRGATVDSTVCVVIIDLVQDTGNIDRKSLAVGILGRELAPAWDRTNVCDDAAGGGGAASIVRGRVGRRDDSTCWVTL